MLDGRAIFRYRLENGAGAYVELTNYGASLVSAVVPDRHGCLEHVVLGFPAAEGYLQDTCYIGATIGRFANRIANAEFSLAGSRYRLDANDGHHSNHGGSDGFDKQLFEATVDGDTVTFSLHSIDGQGGYPGNLELAVSYRWTETNELHIEYTGISDRRTVLNVTNHAYFNLSGGQRTIVDHHLCIDAAEIVETRGDHIPTGVLVPAGVHAFPGVTLRARMAHQGNHVRGLNHCYVLRPEPAGTLRQAARLADPVSGRVLDVCTTYPGLLLYTGDLLHSQQPGHWNRNYMPYDGLCLECQYFPDSPNHPAFPSTVLEAGGRYHERIVYRFDTTT